MAGFSLTLLTYQNKYHCPCLAISHYERHILKLTFLSFWRLISFIIFILCFLSHTYIFSLWGNAGIPDQTVVVWLFSCMVDFVMSLQLSPVKLPKNLLCFGLQSFVSILFQSDNCSVNLIYYFDCCWYSQFNKYYLNRNYTGQKWQITLLLERLYFYGFF